MRKLVALALLAAGCQSTMDRASKAWYESAEVVCHNPSCRACRGSAAVGCGPCGAVGWFKCDKCSDGTQKCNTCKGDGRKDGKTCKTCDGDGKSACSKCGGDQKVDCGTCDGKGKLACLRAIRITEPMPAGDDAWPPAPPK